MRLYMCVWAFKKQTQHTLAREKCVWGNGTKKPEVPRKPTQCKHNRSAFDRRGGCATACKKHVHVTAMFLFYSGEAHLLLGAARVGGGHVGFQPLRHAFCVGLLHRQPLLKGPRRRRVPGGAALLPVPLLQPCCARVLLEERKGGQERKKKVHGFGLAPRRIVINNDII